MQSSRIQPYLHMDSPLRKPLLPIIVGPTAVGKTALTIEVAKHFSCEVISADSRQVYKEMKIGTARPSQREMQGIRHHLTGSISISQHFSAQDFIDYTLAFVHQNLERNPLCLISGGTGFYIKALLEGMDDFPSIPQEVRTTVNKGFQEKGLLWLQEEVKEKDPVFFELVDQHNHARLIRALEIMEASGRPFSSFHKAQTKEELSFRPLVIVLNRPREELYERINMRVDSMMKQGLLEEVKYLVSYKNLKALQTVGYEELFRFIDGALSLDEAVALIKQNTRRYAKRQLTWFRNQHQGHWFHPEDKGGILELIRRNI